ncbi:MAG: MerR family transcriptional regulator [Streptosporangiaceae bacterium]
MDDDGLMTIEQLASQADTATSTVRMYQTRGLLPPPVRRGRIGYYGQGHLSRLRLIADLQEQGFSLASIKRLTDAWESGRSLDDVLGLETQVTSVWAHEEPVRVGLREFREWFPGQKLTPAIIARAIRMGLITIDAAGVVVRNPAFLRIGSELARQGIPAAEALDELQALQAAANTIAERFTGVFERHMWRDFVQAGMPSEQIAPLTQSLARLSELAEDVTGLVLRDALRRKASQFLAEQATRLDQAGVLDGLRPQARAAGLDV